MRKAMGVFAAAVVAACGGSSGNMPPPTPAAAPTFSVAAGTWTAPISVSITAATQDAEIRYTVDGSDPTTASSTYGAPVALATATTLKAIATATGHTPSAVATAVYAFQVAAPTFSVPGGSYTSSRSVEIATTTPGATIHYTTDGADPSAASSIYAGAISLPLPSTTTLRAVGVRAGFTSSAVQAATYSIAEEPAADEFLTFCTSLRDTMARLDVTCRKANPAIFPAARHAEFYCAEVQGEVTAGRVVWDPAQAESCRTAVESSGCPSLQSMPATCSGSLTGTVAQSGTCYMDDECAGGGDCTKSDATPQHSLVCPGICQPSAGVGESCASAECSAGLQCVDLAILGPATCMVRSGAGGSCPCLKGLWCDAYGGPMGMCMAPKTAGTCGGSPLPPQYTEAECAVGYACHGGQCTSIAGPGESCAAHPCGEGYACTAGVCTAWPSVGQPCVGTAPCASGYCAEGTCASYKARGDPCLDHRECLSGICTGGSCARDLCFP